MLKNSRHVRKSQFQNHQDPQQLQETIIRTNISVYSWAPRVNRVIRIGHNSEGGLRKALQGRGDRVAHGEDPDFGVGSNPFSVSCVTGQIIELIKISAWRSEL